MDIYSIITERIITSLEKGVVPWRKPWASSIPSNYISGKRYTGINTFLLGLSNYENPYWLTFKQINGQGGFIKKGEKASIVVYFTLLDKKQDESKNDSDKKNKIPMMKYYNVFNWEQTTGIPEKIPVEEKDNDSILECEKIINNMKDRPLLKNGSDAYYSPKEDYISIPSLSRFDSSEDYFACLFHEMTHWTGHQTRLNREGIKKVAFGSECYSKEELIAEMGASFLSGITGISGKVIDNSTSYIQSWLQVLKGDKKFVISAAAQAQKAANFILGKEDSEV